MKITFTKDVLIPAGVQKSGTTLDVNDAMAAVIKSLGCAKDYVEPVETVAETQAGEETKFETKTTKAAK